LGAPKRRHRLHQRHFAEPEFGAKMLRTTVSEVVMRQEDEVPDYLKDLPDPSEDVVWADLADRFEELSDMLRTLRVETKEQAILICPI
jgi:hypothetical protein